MKKRTINIMILSLIASVLMVSVEAQAQQVQPAPVLIPEASGVVQFNLDLDRVNADRIKREQFLRQAISDMPAVSLPSWHDAVTRARVERAIDGAS